MRYDLLLHKSKDENTNRAARLYTEELIRKHVSGRLKVAPEHTSDHVLRLMRKPSFGQFQEFKRIFDRVNREAGLNQQIIPYFISSHPGCHEEDMAELAVLTKRMDFHLEQVQDFTPTPMTVSTEAWYTGYHPYTLEPVYSAKTQAEKLAQRQFFFWYKPEERRNIERSLRAMGRPDLIKELCPPHNPNGRYRNRGNETMPDNTPKQTYEDNRTKHRGQKATGGGRRRYRGNR